MLEKVCRSLGICAAPNSTRSSRTGARAEDCFWSFCFRRSLFLLFKCTSSFILLLKIQQINEKNEMGFTGIIFCVFGVCKHGIVDYESPVFRDCGRVVSVWQKTYKCGIFLFESKKKVLNQIGYGVYSKCVIC